MAKYYTDFLNEQFKPFVFKNFEVTEARSWDPNKFISSHANVRSKQRFPKFTTSIWQGIIKFAINKLGDEFIGKKDPDAPPGYTGYKSFAIKFNHDGFPGWMTLRVRRHPSNKQPRRFNLMAITVLGPDQPPLKKHDDIIRSLPPTKTPKSMVLEAVEILDSEELDEELAIPNSTKTLKKRRYAMPQIEDSDLKHFFKWIKDEYNVHSDKTKQDPLKLTATQKEFSEEKVDDIVEGGKWDDKPILVSLDGYVIDGHHRWLAAVKTGRKILTYRLKAPISELLSIIKYYPKAKRKNLSESGDSFQILEYIDWCLENMGMNEASRRDGVAKGLQFKTGGGAHKKKKGKGSYDRKKEKKVKKDEY